MPKKSVILTWAFCLYAVASLVSMAVMSVATVILVLAILFAGGQWRGLTASRPVRVYLGAAIALAFVCVLSLVAAKISPLSYGGRFSEVHLLKDTAKLWYLFWPLALLAGLRAISPADRLKVLYAWLAAFAVMSVIGIIQHWAGWPRPQIIPGTDPIRYHATLFLGHHLSVASILIFPFFAVLDFARGSSSRRGLWLLIAALGLVMLFFTHSKTLWVALPAGIALWGCLSLPKKWSAVVIALLLIAVGVGSQRPEIQARFRDQYSIGTREELWKANLEIFRARPVTGVGWLHNHELAGYYLMERFPGQEVFSGHAHNNILDVMGGTGALGLAAWIFWCAVVIWLAWISLRRPLPAFAKGLLCAWVVFQLNGLTQVNFWEAKVTHQMMWVVAWSLLWAATKQEDVRA